LAEAAEWGEAVESPLRWLSAVSVLVRSTVEVSMVGGLGLRRNFEILSMVGASAGGGWYRRSLLEQGRGVVVSGSSDLWFCF
jgi:hypothetical protein